ncbi:hypothetical protein D3C71_1426170 [compost metagenome]
MPTNNPRRHLVWTEAVFQYQLREKGAFATLVGTEIGTHEALQDPFQRRQAVRRACLPQYGVKLRKPSRVDAASKAVKHGFAKRLLGPKVIVHRSQVHARGRSQLAQRDVLHSLCCK